MTLVVDTCILLDILDEDPAFGLKSAQALNAKQENELVISPATYVELAPAFLGDRRLQDQFLEGLDIHVASDEPGVLNAAHDAWNTHVSRKRKGREVRRPIADVFIGALASVHEGLITRNARDFKTLFPDLAIFEP